MKSVFIHLLISLGAAWLLRQAELILDANYLVPFLKQNIITIILSLLAINAATLGIVLTKIRELLDSSSASGSFTSTKKEMLLSIYEQAALVFICLVLLIFSESSWIKMHPRAAEAVSMALVSGFIFSIIILLDTAKSVFVILEVGKK